MSVCCRDEYIWLCVLDSADHTQLSVHSRLLSYHIILDYKVINVNIETVQTTTRNLTKFTSYHVVCGASKTAKRNPARDFSEMLGKNL